MRASVIVALLVTLAVVGQEAETFEWKSVLPWNWAIFHRGSKSDATATSPAPLKMEVEGNSISSGPQEDKSTPVDPKEKNTSTGAKVKRELIYEYDGYD